ncbi:MAG TPA: 6,7-dimethyl-8-ribityllumazine synthase [Bryobacteraceae bacterium]|nr:6,7-dimethyl-8-ribityllumazine synthase [Bryobacteraceae bacterium]
MAKQRIHWSREATGRKFAIVVARFNSGITDRLLDGARRALAEAKAAGFDEFYVPGAFELPLAAKLLAHTHAYHGIVALGAVIRGETPHFEYVAAETARGLQQVALETGVPVAFGVLTTDTLEQAEARADGVHGNKGYDAAMTAVEMAYFADSLAARG